MCSESLIITYEHSCNSYSIFQKSGWPENVKCWRENTRRLRSVVKDGPDLDDRKVSVMNINLQLQSSPLGFHQRHVILCPCNFTYRSELTQTRSLVIFSSRTTWLPCTHFLIQLLSYLSAFIEAQLERTFPSIHFISLHFINKPIYRCIIDVSKIFKLSTKQYAQFGKEFGTRMV